MVYKVKNINYSEGGSVIITAILLIMVIAGVTAIIGRTVQENMRTISINRSAASTFYAAEGAMNNLFGEMGAYGPLWDQLAPLSTSPSGYTEYSPASYSASNGIPPCSGIACHRNYYPVGGGLLKNFGPLESDGSEVDTSFPITEQLDYDDPPSPDVTLGNLSGWVQVERLDEAGPSIDTVGGNLSSSLAEGGNAKSVRYRVTGTSKKSNRGRTGVSVVVAVVELPLS